MVQSLTAVFAFFVIAMAVLSPDGAQLASTGYPKKLGKPAQSVSNEDRVALDRLIAKMASVAYKPVEKRVNPQGGSLGYHGTVSTV